MYTKWCTSMKTYLYMNTFPHTPKPFISIALCLDTHSFYIAVYI